jgi:hypothetical protein
MPGRCYVWSTPPAGLVAVLCGGNVLTAKPEDMRNNTQCMLTVRDGEVVFKSS